MDRTHDLLEYAATGFEPAASDIEDSLARVRTRAVEPPSSPAEEGWASGKRHSRRRKGVTLLILAAALSGGVALANGMLKGNEYAHSIGLTPHPLPSTGDIRMTVDGLAVNGTVLSDCPSDEQVKAAGQSTELVSVGSTLYCVVADTDLDAWLIARRIQGDPVSDAEVQNLENGGRGNLPSGEQIGKLFGFPEGRSPQAYEAGGCDSFAEFDNPRGFCMDSFTGSGKEEILLGHAIGGRALTLDEIDMVSMMLRIHELETTDGASAELAALQTALSERIDPWWESHYGKSAEANAPAYGPCCGDLPNIPRESASPNP
jgi:hypothetical protein